MNRVLVAQAAGGLADYLKKLRQTTFHRDWLRWS